MLAADDLRGLGGCDMGGSPDPRLRVGTKTMFCQRFSSVECVNVALTRQAALAEVQLVDRMGDQSVSFCATCSLFLRNASNKQAMQV